MEIETNTIRQLERHGISPQLIENLKRRSYLIPNTSDLYEDSNSGVIIPFLTSILKSLKIGVDGITPLEENLRLSSQPVLDYFEKTRNPKDRKIRNILRRIAKKDGGEPQTTTGGPEEKMDDWQQNLWEDKQWKNS
ncbi:hypothetical protein P4B35_23585 [Pontiellaceae bacterium B12227]|nr:hypothetical protein [Pontiellaceae bacterium B12227]